MVSNLLLVFYSFLHLCAMDLLNWEPNTNAESFNLELDQFSNDERKECGLIRSEFLHSIASFAMFSPL